MHFEHMFLLLFGVAAAVALLTRRIDVPYTVALVIAGLLLESGHLFKPPTLTKEVLYAVFLPGLLFEAAFHLDFANFRESHRTILGLGIPGLVLAVLATAALVLLGAHFVPGVAVGVSGAVVFGALIAATDPIAVIGTFKHLGAPHRLALIVEAESLLNEGTAVVVFTLALGVASGHTHTAGGLVIEFVRVVGIGAVLGAAVGWVASRVTMRVDEPMVEITLTTIAAYGSFAIAEHFHFSGVIAVVVAGMVCGNYGAVHGMSPATKVAVEAFWQYVAFALNSAVFLLIGFQVRPLALLHLWKPILVSYLAVTLARWIAVQVVTVVLARGREAVPRAWRWVLSWGGLAGRLVDGAGALLAVYAASSRALGEPDVRCRLLVHRRPRPDDGPTASLAWPRRYQRACVGGRDLRRDPGWHSRGARRAGRDGARGGARASQADPASGGNATRTVSSRRFSWGSRFLPRTRVRGSIAP